jgi:integrase/recombinase XerD
MTALRQRCLEDLQLRGLSPRTQESYVRVVRKLAEHYGKPPDQISEEELRQYLLYLKNEKHAARNACTLALCSRKFFYQQMLKRDWPVLDFVRPAGDRKLPVVLSVEEVQQILGCVRRARYRVCLSLIYACGLRSLEGVQLPVADVDGARMVIHVRHRDPARWASHCLSAAQPGRRVSGGHDARAYRCGEHPRAGGALPPPTSFH